MFFISGKGVIHEKHEIKSATTFFTLTLLEYAPPPYPPLTVIQVVFIRYFLISLFLEYLSEKKNKAGNSICSLFPLLIHIF